MHCCHVRERSSTTKNTESLVAMTSFYTKLAAGLIFPLHERIKNHDSVQGLKDLEHSQWLNETEFNALRTRRLRELLCHAQSHVPYFTALFSSLGLSPQTSDPWATLRALPLLSKELIRNNFTNLRADNASKTKVFSTTGSSGDPLRFELSNRRVSRDIAAKWRATRWWDVDIGDKEIVAWSSPIELNKQDRIKAIRDALLRTKLLPAIALQPERLDDFIDKIQSFRPAMLFGYPSSLTLVAQRAIDRGVNLAQQGIKVVFVTAERLYPHQRHTLEQVFGAKVANGYGGRDAGFIAHECPQGNLHVTAEDIIVEIVDERGKPLPNGTPGQVCITHLHTHEFPFIRYLNGDIASLSDERCACGRTLPLLKEVQGRTNDFLLAESGAKVHDVAFAMLLRDMPGMRQFKIIQEHLHHVTLQLVTTPEFAKETHQQRIQNSFQHFLGPKTVVDIQYVADIPPEPSGKYRYVVNRLTTPINSDRRVSANA
jgi:phenylacetate-CoA ligase